jgi:hypothetical protein
MARRRMNKAMARARNGAGMYRLSHNPSAARPAATRNHPCNLFGAALLTSIPAFTCLSAAQEHTLNAFGGHFKPIGNPQLQNN